MVLYLDLGVSSPQFDNAERGFSYNTDARLDMRMNQEQPLSAYEVVNNYSYQDLVTILYKYADEKFAKSIARMIEKERQVKPIETTFELVEIVKRLFQLVQDVQVGILQNALSRQFVLK